MHQAYGAVNSTDDIFIVPNVELAIPDLTVVIQALEQFRDFQPNIKGCAIALYSSQLASQHGWEQSTAEFHLYVIALHAGLEVAQ